MRRGLAVFAIFFSLALRLLAKAALLFIAGVAGVAKFFSAALAFLKVLYATPSAYFAIYKNEKTLQFRKAFTVLLIF